MGQSRQGRSGYRPSVENLANGTTGRRCLFEPLEGRRMLAVITVTSPLDNTVEDGRVTLREAIIAANNDTVADAQASRPQKGDGADTIRFNFYSYPSLNLTVQHQVSDFTFGPSAFVISGDVTIEGPSKKANIVSYVAINQYLDIDKYPNFRAFTILEGAHLTLTNIEVSGFHVAGGDGRSTGGGGGAGLGGAIFNAGTLTLQNSSMSYNTARGGAPGGTASGPEGGGGGGGLFGDGGHGLPTYRTARGGGGGGTAGSGSPIMYPHEVPPDAGNGGIGPAGGGANGGDSDSRLGGLGFSGGGGGAGTDGQFRAGDGGDGGFGAGGGGGGGGDYVSATLAGNGGDGGFGGGGGGAGVTGYQRAGNGGNGGFGGGGGAGAIAGRSGFGGGSSVTVYGLQSAASGAGIGGAVFNYRGTVEVFASDLRANLALGGSSTGAGMGGAIFNYLGTVAVRDSKLDDNSASGGYNGDRYISTTSIGDGFGGAIFNYGGSVSAINSIFHSNAANYVPFVSFSRPGLGGGIYNLNGDVNLVNDTFLQHNAFYGGAVYNRSDALDPNVQTARTIATLKIANSIMASQWSIDDLNGSSSGGVQSITFDPATNLIKNYSGAVGRDPMVNRSSSFYPTPEPGSPAIDAGDNAAAIAAGITADVRGGLRFFDGDMNGSARVDIGAVELGFGGFKPLSDLTIEEDHGGGFLVEKIPSDMYDVAIHITSDNPTLLPPASFFSHNDYTTGIGFYSAPNSSGSATVTVESSAFGATYTQTFHVTVTAVADTPNLSVPQYSTVKNPTEMIPLNIQASLNDNDGSEDLEVLIYYAPRGAKFVQGDKQVGTYDARFEYWKFRADELPGLSLLIDHHAHFGTTLQITARATEKSNGDFKTVTQQAGIYFRVYTPDSILVLGAAAGASPLVKIIDVYTGQTVKQFYPYPKSFSGGVRVSTGDLTGDGVAEIITAPGKGRTGVVKVFDLAGNELTGFQTKPYRSNFKGGVFAAVADVNGDGQFDLVTTPDKGRTAEVRVYFNRFNSNSADPFTSSPQRKFLALGDTYTGGVTVAAGDLTGDGKAEVIVGNRPGSAPIVRAFNLAVFSQTSTLKLAPRLFEFVPFKSTDRGGLSVAVGNLQNDARDEIIVGNGTGGRIQLFNADGTRFKTINAYTDSSRNAPIYVAAKDNDSDRGGDLYAEVLAGQGVSGSSKRLKSFYSDASQIDNAMQSEADFRHGFFVA